MYTLYVMFFDRIPCHFYFGSPEKFVGHKEDQEIESLNNALKPFDLLIKGVSQFFMRKVIKHCKLIISF
jgi:hypothetical protein